MPDETQSTQKTVRTFNSIAKRYRRMKARPLTHYIVEPTVLGLIGEVKGLDAIDLACGEGRWTRVLKRLGAATASGVDISEEMIRLAEASEQSEPLGCSYRIADVATLDAVRTYDIAVGAFLLNYASSPEQLLAFCRTAARLLKPNGRFVGINSNMSLDVTAYGYWRELGRWMTTTEERRNGDPITIHLIGDDGKELSFDNYYLSPSIYEEAFDKAGFKSFRWVQPSISNDALSIRPPDFWNRLLKHPQVIGFEAEL
ncbi:MAG: methyltransferase domain-containing protein [Pseudomonadota bacterium]